MDTSFLSFMIYIVKIILCVGQLWPALQYRNRGNCLHVLSTVQLNIWHLGFSCVLQNPEHWHSLCNSIRTILQKEILLERKEMTESFSNRHVMIQNVKQSKITWCENDIKCGFYFVVLIANKSFQEVHISGCKFKNCGFICLVWHSWDKFP